jgi:nicotinate-nucleotide pyrophosphorylase
MRAEQQRLKKDIGFGDDWSHLNKRRQRSRRRMVRRDLGIVLGVGKVKAVGERAGEAPIVPTAQAEINQAVAP